MTPIPSPIVLDNKEGSMAGSEVSRSSGGTFALPTKAFHLEGLEPYAARYRIIGLKLSRIIGKSTRSA